MNTITVTKSLTMFFMLSYLLCVGVGFLIPAEYGMHSLLEALLPGFEWISVSSFFIGLVGSGLWGVYIGVGYSIIYNKLQSD